MRLDEGTVLGLVAWIPGAMPPDRRYGAQFPAPQVAHLEPVVVHLEVEVVIPGHQQSLRLDGGKRLGAVALVKLVGADVAVLPGPELRQEVRRIPAGEVGLPGGHQVVLERRGGSAINALAAPSMNTLLWGAQRALPQTTAIRSTAAGNSAAQ